MSDLPVDPEDIYHGEVMVAGGVWMAVGSRFKATPVTTEEGQATNELYVWPDFMKSRYRITVTFDPERKEAEQ